MKGGHIVTYIEERERTIPEEKHYTDCGAKVFYLLGYCDIEGYKLLLRYSIVYGITQDEVLTLLDSKGDMHEWKRVNMFDVQQDIPVGSATILALHAKHEDEYISGHYAILVNNGDNLYVIDPQQNIGLSDGMKYDDSVYFDNYDLTKSQYLSNTSDQTVLEESYLSASDIERVLPTRVTLALPRPSQPAPVPSTSA